MFVGDKVRINEDYIRKSLAIGRILPSRIGYIGQEYCFTVGPYVEDDMLLPFTSADLDDGNTEVLEEKLEDNGCPFVSDSNIINRGTDVWSFESSGENPGYRYKIIYGKDNVNDDKEKTVEYFDVYTYMVSGNWLIDFKEREYISLNGFKRQIMSCTTWQELEDRLTLLTAEDRTVISKLLVDIRNYVEKGMSGDLLDELDDSGVYVKLIDEVRSSSKLLKEYRSEVRLRDYVKRTITVYEDYVQLVER